jgi:D-amino-acid dehydrogenase
MSRAASPAAAGRSGRVVVVGGGVIGAACAYFLRQAGRDVMLIDSGQFGRGCSHGNCGFVSPSHVLPLAGPGAIAATLKTLFKKNSPLKVRLRFDPALWSWFWRFSRRCNLHDALAAGHAIQRLLASSRALYDELFRTILTDVEWDPAGVLFVHLTHSSLEHYAETDRLLQAEFGLAATRLEGEVLQSFEPALKPSVAGAWRYSADGQLRPDKLMLAWRHALESIGVEIRERCAMRDLLVDRRLVRGIKTDQGEVPIDQAVVATGAWTPQLRRLLGCAIQIQPGKGYTMTMPRPAFCPRTPMIFEEHRVAVSPMQSAYRIGSTMEFAGYDATLNRDRLRLLQEAAPLYLKEPLPSPAIEEWWGWRPMTPDGLPFIGRLPAFDNLYVAAGHGMLGVSMSPATGKLAAELVTGQMPHVDPTPYAVSRNG